MAPSAAGMPPVMSAAGLSHASSNDLRIRSVLKPEHARSAIGKFTVL